MILRAMKFVGLVTGLLLAASMVPACEGTEAPEGLWMTQRQGGPRVVFDLFNRPLPEVPLPNDIATRPDPSSPTGRRINASQLAPTGLEEGVRYRLDQVDGWGTYGAITVSFEPVDQLLDIGNIMRRHIGDNFEFTDDAIYLVNIDRDSPNFGMPTPLDIGEGNFPVNLEQRDRYYDNDPRGHTSNLMFETTYEDSNGNGRLDLCEDRNRNGETDPGEDLDGDGVAFSAERDLNGDGVLDPEEDINGNGRLDCSEDTDFDGHLDIPNLFCGLDDDTGERIPPWECPDVTIPNPIEDVVRAADDQWLLSFYEMESNLITMRPVIPLEEATEYAVVLTNRLVDESGLPVESPFDAVHHIDQTNSVSTLGAALAEHPEYYGGLGQPQIQFVWTFTTQSVTNQMADIREGLYGRGPLAELADEYPPEIFLDELYGCGVGDCVLPDNRYVVQARASGDAAGLIDILEQFAGEAFGLDEDEYQPLAETYDYVDYMVLTRFYSPNYLDNNGQSEDLDGDGNLDELDEDVNGNGVLDPGEDLDLDGHLDVDEDINDNHVMEGEEGYFDIETHEGRHPHNRHMVTALVTIPLADPARGIEPPFPVVFYGHGYTSSRIESLGFAGSLAKFGFASIGVECVHHGLALDDSLRTLIEAATGIWNLSGLYDSIRNDRARDLNGDGTTDPGGDFWTAYLFHTRDIVRQSGIDHMRMIQILRSFDGERLSGVDYDADGTIELAGDFNADGIVDIGGPDNDYHVWGQSLGGIMAAFLAGLEPAVATAAPVAGGGGLGDVGIRSRQGGVKEAVILRMMGPLAATTEASRYIRVATCSEDGDCPRERRCVDGFCRCDGDAECVGNGFSGYRCTEARADLENQENICTNPRDDTVCGINEVSARFIVPDLNDTGEVEYACLDPEEVREGNTIVVENHRNEERGCFVTWPNGRSRIHIPSDFGDRLTVTIYEGEVLVDSRECEVREDAEVVRVIDEFEVDTHFQFDDWGPYAICEDEDGCVRSSGEYMEGDEMPADPLVAPAEGFGLRRVTPEMRRFMGIAQTVLEPGDPANMALRYFGDPVDYGDETSAANVMVIATIGDMNVPVNTGISIARAAGILDIYNPDPRYDGMTQNRFLINNEVIMGLERLSSFRRESDGRQVLFDPDDYDRSGSPIEAGWLGDELGAPSHPTPLRSWVPSVAGEVCTCLDDSGEHDCASPADTVGPLEMVRCEGGVSLLSMPYLRIDGEHGFALPEPDLPFDISTYMINFVGYYMSTGGTEVRFNVCLADSSCTEAEHGFYVPPVPANRDE